MSYPNEPWSASLVDPFLEMILWVGRLSDGTFSNTLKLMNLLYENQGKAPSGYA